MGAGAPASLARSDGRASVKATLRWSRPLAVVALGFLVAVTFRARPAPGVTGQGLVVTLALVVFVASLLAFERTSARTQPLRVVLIGTMVASAATLVAIQPDGPGFLAMLPPISAAAFRFRREPALVVAAAALAAFVIAAAAGKPRPLDGAILDGLAIAAYFGLATFCARFILADERSQFLIAQLEETRAAQAVAATLGERQRVAREMHDVLAHSLAGLVLNLEGARLMTERGGTDPALQEAIARAHRLAKTGLEEAQRAIGMLRDDTLPGPQRLAQLAEEFADDTGVPCSFTVHGDERELVSECRLALYRIAQESLTNIRKHAVPDRVEVNLAFEPGGTRLVVEDFESPSEHALPPGGGTGYGLAGMRERAALLGGTLISGPTGSGFRVELWAPL
jgi:signal transduction histidine kinase